MSVEPVGKTPYNDVLQDLLDSLPREELLRRWEALNGDGPIISEASSMKLRPIEEAPKDYGVELFLLYGKKRGEGYTQMSQQSEYAVGYWWPNIQCWVAYPTIGETVYLYPTHFAELPEEPTNEGE